MENQTFPKSFRMPEGSFRMADRMQVFRQFYLAELRPVLGHRLSSTALRGAYLTWCEATGHPSLSFRDIARAMDMIGHRRLLSNGYRYLDVDFAFNHPGIAAGLPALGSRLPRSPGASIDEVIMRVDRALADLSKLRSDLNGLRLNELPR